MTNLPRSARQKVFSTLVRATVEEVWAFHSSAEALRVLTPKERHVELIDKDLSVREGALHRIRVRQFGLPLLWYARISEVEPPHAFTDTAERSPFPFWRHRHEFLEHPEGCLLKDTVDYVPPGGPLSGLVDALVVSKQLDELFRFRHRATKAALESKA